MKTVAHVVTADSLESFPPKDHSVARSEFRQSRLLPKFSLQKPHPPAREYSTWSGRYQARIASPGFRITQETISTAGEPVGIGENFCIDASDKRRSGARDARISSSGNSLILVEAQQRNLTRTPCPIW